MKKWAIVVALGMLGAGLWPVLKSHAGHGKKGDWCGLESHGGVEKLSKKLNLTDDQKKTVQAAFEEASAKMKAVHDETHDKIHSALTPEQQAIFTKMEEDKGHKAAHGKKEGKACCLGH